MAEKKESINNVRDWSNLPTDIVHLIAKKLPDLIEFVRFRVVCKSWRSSALLSDPSQIPWLLEISGDSFDTSEFVKTELRFYSITSDKTITIPINKFGWFRGASCHYLPSYDDLKDAAISLFNPLTRKEIVYPPIGHIDHKILLSPWMVWTGTSPICDRNILIIDRDSLPNKIGQWLFYDAQHETWTEYDGFFYNFCYYQEKLFSASSNFVTNVTDISSKTLLHTIPPPEDGYHTLWPVWIGWPCLVESSGEILAVSWLRNLENNTIEEPKFDIHRLDFGGENRQPCWIRISDIGDQIIFLGERTSFSITAAPSSTGFKSGCIYFQSDNQLYVHHVVTGCVEKVPCPFENCTWFLPGLN